MSNSKKSCPATVGHISLTLPIEEVRWLQRLSVTNWTTSTQLACGVLREWIAAKMPHDPQGKCKLDVLRKIQG